MAGFLEKTELTGSPLRGPCTSQTHPENHPSRPLRPAPRSPAGVRQGGPDARLALGPRRGGREREATADRPRLAVSAARGPRPTAPASPRGRRLREQGAAGRRAAGSQGPGGAHRPRAEQARRPAASAARPAREARPEGLVGGRRPGAVTSGRKRSLREAAPKPAVTGVSRRAEDAG